MLLEIVVVEEVEALRERRLQARITRLNTQRIAVVIDFEQVADGRLTGIAAIGEAQLTGLRLLPTEIDRRREVGNGTGGVCTQTYGLAIDTRGIVLNEV